MGFGNPYGDPYDLSIVSGFVDILSTLRVKIISLADTIGVSTPDQITHIFKEVNGKFPDIEFGAHLHSNPASVNEKIEAAFRAGCKRFDGAIKGWGGCPMAKDDLVGNLATEKILDYLESQNAKPIIDETAFAAAMQMADRVFAG